MEEQDYDNFVPLFKTECDKKHLNQNGCNCERIVPRERRIRWIPEMTADQQRDHKTAKEADPCLFDSKRGEDAERGADTASFIVARKKTAYNPFDPRIGTLRCRL